MEIKKGLNRLENVCPYLEFKSHSDLVVKNKPYFFLMAGALPLMVRFSGNDSNLLEDFICKCKYLSKAVLNMDAPYHLTANCVRNPEKLDSCPLRDLKIE